MLFFQPMVHAVLDPSQRLGVDVDIARSMTSALSFRRKSFNSKSFASHRYISLPLDHSEIKVFKLHGI